MGASLLTDPGQLQGLVRAPAPLCELLLPLPALAALAEIGGLSGRASRRVPTNSNGKRTTSQSSCRCSPGFWPYSTARRGATPNLKWRQ